jgi:beta-barrel assembly-enhancing protease
VYRLRNEDADVTQAMQSYERAIATNHAPAEAHRSMGFIYQRRRDYPNARQAFERYLQLQPDADDRDAIRSYISEGTRGT